jgi:transcriptional regulator with XRE-family HTH domain
MVRMARQRKPEPAKEISWPDRLKALRNSHGMTQAQVAAKCRVTLSAWQKWEYGRTKPAPMVELLLTLLFGDLTQYDDKK